MKKFLVVLLVLLIVVAAGAAVLMAVGVFSPDALLEALGLKESATALVSRLSDYRAPEGEGRLLDGGLPEDLLPDAETRYGNFPEELYPYRAMLTEAERSVYAQAYGNALELYEQFPLHTPVTPEALGRAMTAVFSDHPALFWAETAYRYYYGADGLVVAVALYYNDTAQNITQARSTFDSTAQAVVLQARQLDSAVEMEKYVHDYLLENVSYVLDAPLNQSAYSALVYGESVCAGYARAFQYLMQQLGIPCYLCSGFAGEAHAWNIVKLDGEYYNVDVTWDDPLGNSTGRLYYNYFNLTDAQLFTDHTRDGLSVNLPACNGTAYSYANAFGAAESAAPAAAGLRTPEEAGFSRGEAVTTLEGYYTTCEDKLAALGEGTHTFTLLVETEALLQSIFSETESQAAMGRYLPGAAKRLGANGYSASVSLQGEALSDGYWLLTQQVQLTLIGAGEQPGGQTAREAESSPAPAPIVPAAPSQPGSEAPQAPDAGEQQPAA